MDLKQTRLMNARLAFEREGGVGSVAKRMGYSNSSFLVQIFGPNPNREPTEKTMRKIEKALGLPTGALDKPVFGPLAAEPPPKGTPAVLNREVLTQVIELVNKLVNEERVNMNAERFSSLIVMAYEDAADHGGAVRESKMRQVVQLLH